VQYRPEDVSECCPIKTYAPPSQCPNTINNFVTKRLFRDVNRTAHFLVNTMSKTENGSESWWSAEPVPP
jgi:hypothetical protein